MIRVAAKLNRKEVSGLDVGVKAVTDPNYLHKRFNFESLGKQALKVLLSGYPVGDRSHKLPSDYEAHHLPHSRVGWRYYVTRFVYGGESKVAVTLSNPRAKGNERVATILSVIEHGAAKRIILSRTEGRFLAFYSSRIPTGRHKGKKSAKYMFLHARKFVKVKRRKAGKHLKRAYDFMKAYVERRTTKEAVVVGGWKK